ncbi:MAG: hypothetical protein IPP47_07875 [Bryobacterales bacterium]|nr:hypothetical protein [Bryobacterales bacterium]
MRPNLDSLSEEILQYIKSENIILFRSMSRAADQVRFIDWDTDHEPDFRRFLECAMSLGVRLIHFHNREFRSQHREEALAMLEDLGLSREAKRELERRIRDLAIYEGFTCAVELTFDYEGRVYLYEMQTEWYEEWQDILDDLELDTEIDGDEASGFGGFYSNN